MVMIRLRYQITFAMLMALLLIGLHASASTNNLDLDILIAGVKHYDSLLKSGKGRIYVTGIYPEFYKKLVTSPPVFRDITADCAFEDRKLRCESNAKFFGGRNMVQIFNGNLTFSIVQKGNRHRVRVRDKNRIEERLEPRNWGLRIWKVPVGEFLEKYATKISGKETCKVPVVLKKYATETFGKEIQKERTGYIVDTKSPHGAAKVWICPEQGYREVKFEFEHKFDNLPCITSTEVVYQEMKKDVWFPRLAITSVRPLNPETNKQELLFAYVLVVKEFQVNVDVSELFEINLPPETPVYDGRLQEMRTLKDVLE